jgi:hypothetical protein
MTISTERATSPPVADGVLAGMGAKGKDFYVEGPGEVDERLAWYERAGATTLLAMPFGDRPAIVDRLAGAVAA